MYCSQLITHPVSNPVPSGLFNLSSTLSFASHVEAEFSYITCAQHRVFARGCEIRISFHRRKTSDWSTRDHVTLPNSKWRQYIHRLFFMKAGSLERTAFVHSSMQRRNKTLWVLWNCLDTWKLFYYFFYRKDKAKLCFLQQDFLIYKKKLEHELNEL